MVRKELLHIVRDPRNLFLVTLSPAFLLFLLAYIFTFEVTDLSLAVLDLDHSPLARRYVATLTGDGDFVLVRSLSAYDEIEPLLVRGEIDAAVVIPPGFARTVSAGRPASVQVVLDGSDPFSGNQVVSSLGARSAAFALGEGGTGSAESAQAIEVHTQAWYNAGLKSQPSMVPGLLAIVLIMPTLALALALTREKEAGTLEGLVASPIRSHEYLLGKLIAYMGMGVVAALLALLVAVLWFHVPFRGSLAVYVLLSADYLLACMGVAVLVSDLVKSQQTALFIVLLVFLVPSFFLAGLISPPSSDSLVAQLATFALPSSHFIEISRTIFLKGLGLPVLVRPVLVLLGQGLGAIVLGMALFKKKVG